MMAAGPAIDEASHAPNNQPEPIREPSPSKTSCERLILLLFDLLFFHNYSFLYAEKFNKLLRYNYTLDYLIVKLCICINLINFA